VRLEISGPLVLSAVAVAGFDPAAHDFHDLLEKA